MAGSVRSLRVLAAILFLLFVSSPIVSLAQTTETPASPTADTAAAPAVDGANTPTATNPAPATPAADPVKASESTKVKDTAVWFWLPVTLLLVAALLVLAMFKDQFFKPKESEPIRYLLAEEKIFVSTQKIGLAVLAFALAGVGGIALFSGGIASQEGSYFAYLGTDLLIAAAAAGAGALLGFIFGIPRSTVQTAQIATGQDGTTQDKAVRAALAANTNLERVSDWLTTLLVGATLVQLGPILDWVHRVAVEVGGSQLSNTSIIPFVMAYFASLAFLGVYMITRLYFTTALAQTLSQLDGTAVERHSGDVVTQLDAVRKQVVEMVSSGDANADATKKREALEGALGFYERSNLTEDQRRDPNVALAVAKVLAAYLNLDGIAATQERRLQYETAIRIAAKKADNLELLKKALGTEEFVTKQADKDTALKTELSKL